MPGLLQKFVCESDGDVNLQHALAIPFTWEKSATHYSVSQNDRGEDVLTLYWSAPRDDATFPLPYRLTVENVFYFVKSWLDDEKRARGNGQGGDGSDVPGWRIELCLRDYVVLTVAACYNYYSK